MITLDGKFTNASIYAETIEDGVYSQVYSIINNPAFSGQKVVCMPDVHVGKSGPCGLTATIGNYICPDHVGVDIGCSVSMMILDKKLNENDYPNFENKIKRQIPMGFNIHKKSQIDIKDFCKFLTIYFNRYRQKWPEMLSDLPDTVTEKWISCLLKRIGMDEGMFWKSLGTVGGGNHFLEYGESDDFGAFTMHFGSRNLGVKICNYWMNKAKGGALSKSEIKEYTQEFKSNYIKNHSDMKNFKDDLNKYLESKKEGHIEGYLKGENMSGYLCDMAFGQLYAAYNHKTVQKLVSEILLKFNIKVDRIITSTHNFIDLEDRILRKSAIASYEGTEILVPFNMRDGIAICEGLSNPEWNYSCSHGAGRKMSRSKAKQNISLDDFRNSMKNVYSTCINTSTIDEAPMAYKDTEEIKRLISETCKVKYMVIPKINLKAAE